MDDSGKEQNRQNYHHDSKEKPVPKEIDNKTLAAMLRESADIVERGEFDAVLYNALQDFRVYYKAHYPKKKEKSSASGRTHSQSRARGKPSEMNINASTSKDDKTTEGAAVSGEHAKPASSKSLDSGHNGSVEETGAKQPSSTVEEPDTKEEVFRDAGASEALEALEADATPQADVPNVKGAGQATPGSPSMSRSNRSENSNSNPVSSSPSSTIQKATANTLFGKLKFPKIVPNHSAFAATSKKNAERLREDLEVFSNPMAQQAESSRRRKSPVDSNSSGGSVWCEKHFVMNCACQMPTSSTHEASSTSQPMQPQREHAGAGSTERSTTSQKHASASYAHVDGPHNNSNNNAPPPSAVSGARVTSTGETSEAATTHTSSQAGGTSVESTAAVKGVSTNPFDHHPFEAPEETNTAEENVTMPAKPDFQKPVNANSSLVANGWIEQHRRSKMRFVWKEVLASLVQGRRPGEETTLWIQREIVNPNTQKKELEALHQVPVKLLESCTYLDYTPDNRFTLKLLGSAEDFVFRCRTDQAAVKWTEILQKHQQILKEKSGEGVSEKSSFEEEKKGQEPSSQQQQQQQQRITISELRAICHGAGINTAGMERRQLESAAEEVRQLGTFFTPPPGAPPPIPVPPAGAQAQQKRAPPPPPAPAPAPEPQAPTPAPNSSGNPTLSISELRAICHGAGINTAGMERGQLELAAEEVRKRGTFFPPPPGPSAHSAAAPKSGGSHHSAPPPAAEHTAQPPPPPQPAPPEQRQERMTISELRAICHGAGINTAGMERQQLEAAAEQVRQRGTFFDPPGSNSTKTRTASAPAASGPPFEEQQATDDLQCEAAMLREEHNRQKMEEEHRRRVAEQEHQRRVAEQQAAEQRRRYAEQQAAWQKQQQEEEHRRRMAEQQAAEQRRRHEEAMRQQQQWHYQQHHQQWHQQHQQHWTEQQRQQWHHWQQQQRQHPRQQQQHRPSPHPQQQSHGQQQQQQQHNHHSAASEKYAKMANQSEDGSQANITRIKHDILIHWALQPPQLQMLRPIDHLVTSIHKVFPPALGVPAHDYFQKWKALTGKDVCNDAGLPDEERLKKAVRKIRFFLHPDKLPKDLNAEQSFTVKMLWDVTSDAWEEFEKRKEDLDWINN